MPESSLPAERIVGRFGQVSAARVPARRPCVPPVHSRLSAVRTWVSACVLPLSACSAEPEPKASGAVPGAVKRQSLPRNASAPICAFSGGMRVAGMDSFRILSQFWASSVYTVDVMSLCCSCAYRSTAEEVILCVIPRTFSRHPSSHITLGGWSFGSRPAFQMMTHSDASMEAPRGLFTLDDRGPHPVPRRPVENCPAPLYAASFNRSLVQALAGLVDHFEPVPRSRCAWSLAVRTPLTLKGAGSGFQDDTRAKGRQALYARAPEMLVLVDADHFTVGADHAWDIAAKIR